MNNIIVILLAAISLAILSVFIIMLGRLNRFIKTNKVDDLNVIVNSYKNMFITLAVVLGGTWTLFIFISTFTYEQAKSNLELNKLELETKRLYVLEAEIETCDYINTENGKNLIHINVKLENKGERTVKAEIRNNETGSPVKVKHVTFLENGKSFFNSSAYLGELLHIRNEFRLPIDLIEISPDSSQHLSFMVQVPGPGVYYVQFEIPFEPDIEKEVKELLGKDYVTTFTSEYIVIE